MRATQPLPADPPILLVQVEIEDNGGLSQRLAFIGKQHIFLGNSSNYELSFLTSEQPSSPVVAELEQVSEGYVLRNVGSPKKMFLPQGQELAAEAEVLFPIGAPPLEIRLGSPGPTYRFSIGRVYPFGDYLITGQLGEGGMARVFSAQEASGLRRRVVLKIIAAQFLLSVSEDEAEAMLAEEARIASQIAHANVVKIFRIGRYQGTPYIEMEYLHGVTLSSIVQQLLQNQVCCPFDLAAALVQQACLGLHAAHEARDPSGRSLQIVHRDFSPQNIMCSPDGEVKLIDFGIACALGRRPWSTDGLFMGKAAYASPEQISTPEQVDRRSDLFAAGATLYELIVGASLFDRGSDYFTTEAVKNDPVPPIAGVPDELNKLLSRVLSKDPSGRPTTAEQLAEELEVIIQRAGGRYLKPRNIAVSLQKLGVCLDAPPPRPLHTCPTVFSQLHCQAINRGPTAELAVVSATHCHTPLFPALRTEPACETIPAQLTIGPYRLAMDQRLQEYTASDPDLYSHTIFSAWILASAEDTGVGTESARVHLIGATGLHGPLAPPELRLLEGFVERWRHAPASLAPLVELLAADEAWPGGPSAIIVRNSQLLWADVLPQALQRRDDVVALCMNLFRCLLLLSQYFPGFTQGELGPSHIELAKEGSTGSRLSPRLFLGGCLDWLLATAPHPVPTFGPLSCERSLYLAPECLSGIPPTPASDVFSAALLSYGLLGGNLSAATWALRQGGRLPPLPPSSPATPAIAEALVAALQQNPARRPVASELLRLCEAPGLEPCGALELPVPPPGQVLTVTNPEGRKVHLHALRLETQLHRRPIPLPFFRIPRLLPAGIGLYRFRDSLAVELLEPLGNHMLRARLYPESSCTGTNRIFLKSGVGAFEIGSRAQNCLQRIDYQAVGAMTEMLEVPLHNLRIVLSRPCGVVLFLTRESRSGDLHLCCAELAD